MNQHRNSFPKTSQRIKQVLGRPLDSILASDLVAFSLIGCSAFVLSCASGQLPTTTTCAFNSHSACMESIPNLTHPNVTGGTTSGSSSSCCIEDTANAGCYLPDTENCLGGSANEVGGENAIQGSASFRYATAENMITQGTLDATNPEASPSTAPDTADGPSGDSQSATDMDFKPGLKNPNNLQDLKGIQPIAGKGGGKNSKDSAGQSGGSAVLTGGLAPAAVPSSETLIALNYATGQEGSAAGQYATGKGASGSGKQSASAFEFANPSTDSTQGVVNFNNDGTQGSGASNSSNEQNFNDPEDYLTRIGIDESLFKRVERKHLEKQRLWLNESRPNKLK